MKVAVCTVAGPGALPGVRLLGAALRARHPEWPLTVLLLPGARRELLGEDAFATLSLGDLAVPALEDAAATMPVAHLAACARPRLVGMLLGGDADAVLLLPPDAELLGGLGPLLDGVAGDAPVMLVPRLLGHLPDDGRRPGAAELALAGAHDDELVALRDDPRALRFLEGWTEAALAGRASLDAAPAALEGVRRCEDPGIGVSAWNLHERPLARGGDGALTVAGAPLRLMRFAGFRADRPWWLAADADRVIVLDDPLLTELCTRRAEALRAAGWQPPDADQALASGLRLDDRLRRLHGEAIDAGERFGDLERAGAAEAFVAWLREPAPQGGAAGVNRYAFDVWRTRPDLQEAYPDLDGADGEGLVGWLWVHGLQEQRLDERLLPAPPDWYDRGGGGVPAVEVVGYLTASLGLGVAARATIDALTAAKVPVATRTIELPGRAGEHPFAERTLPEDPAIRLICLNAEQLAEQFGAAAPPGHVIGYWAWEIDVIPPWWGPAYDLVDEIWVYSRFVAENIGRDSPKPVVVMPLAVTAPGVPVGAVLPPLPDGPIMLFAFDYLSTVERKNPLGLIRAFTRAFAPGEGPTLVVKSVNADLRPYAREQLRHAAGGREDVVFLDAALSAADHAALFARADVYVSLHRSEGFGLTLAEAMALGKPVVATHFGGNADFMTPANSFLVDWRPAPVGSEAEHYLATGTWAEPDLDHAAALLRRVWEQPEEAARRGARARADVEALLSPRAVGELARARLRRIAERAAPAAVPWPLSDVDDRLRSGPERHRAAGLRGLARRGLLRAMRPYTAHERGVDQAVAASLHRLHVELEAERAARDRDRLRLERLERLLTAAISRRNGRGA